MLLECSILCPLAMQERNILCSIALHVAIANTTTVAQLCKV